MTARLCAELASIHPLELYAATLESLHVSYQDSPILRQTFPEFYGMLRRELQWVESPDVLGKKHLALSDLMVPAESDWG